MDEQERREDPEIEALRREAIENVRAEYASMGLDPDETLRAFGVAGAGEAGSDGDAGAEQGGAAPAPAPAAGMQEPPGPPPGIYLDPANLYGSLRAMAEADPQFAQVVRTFAGRERAREERRRIAELEAELEAMRKQYAELIVGSVPDEERGKRAESDETFRQLLETAQREVPDPEEVVAGVEFENALDTIFDRYRGVIPDWRLSQYAAAIDEGGCANCSYLGRPHGILDHDRNGNEVSALNGLLMLQEMLEREARPVIALQQRGQAAVPAPAVVAAQTAQQAPVSTPQAVPSPNAAGVSRAMEEMRNPRLAQNPDVADVQAVAGGQRRVMSIDELASMPVDDILARWPNPGDLFRAVQAGEVVLNEGATF